VVRSRWGLVGSGIRRSNDWSHIRSRDRGVIRSRCRGMVRGRDRSVIWRRGRSVIWRRGRSVIWSRDRSVVRSSMFGMFDQRFVRTDFSLVLDISMILLVLVNIVIHNLCSAVRQFNPVLSLYIVAIP